MMATLSRNMWISQRQLAGRMPFRRTCWPPSPPAPNCWSLPAAILDELARGAAEITYANNFYLLHVGEPRRPALIPLLASRHSKRRRNHGPATATR